MTDASGAQRQVQALRDAAQRRTDKAVKAAEHGIRVLIKDGGQISFAAVARAGGVSTKFLHGHQELAQRIRILAGQQHGVTEDAHEHEATGESAVIAALRRRLRDQQARHKQEVASLRERVREQDRQIQALYGQLPGAGSGSPA